MTPAGKPLSVEKLAALVGDVDVPGSLDEFAEAILCPRRNVLRCRRGVAPSELPLATDPVDWYGLARRPQSDTPKPSRTIAYAAADFYLQDAGSLLALAAAGADSSALEGLLVCDLCAAPGGKASALVEAIGDQGGFVLANEVIRSRIGPLDLNLARTGSNRYAITNLDPERLATQLAGVFDVVVVDAPCSGQALLGRGKQNLSALSLKQIEHSAARQQRILDSAVRLLRGGGQLVYSTCTFAEAENEAQVHRLIASDLVEPREVPHLVESTGACRSGEGCYRLWPHVHNCAGSFAALMTRDEDADLESNRPSFRDRKRDRRLPVDLTQWYEDLPPSRTHLRDSVIFGWPEDAPAWVEQIALGGPELAHLVGQTWKPSHAAAIRRGASAARADSFALDTASAKSFLRGEPISIAADGWQIVSYQDRPLGWVKASRGRGKNHLPASARASSELVV